MGNSVSEYYGNEVMREWERHEKHPVEFAITMRYIKKYTKSGDKVLDIGGGPGRYSTWLAQMGCDVTLFDLTQGNIDFAKQKSKELGLNINAICGNALDVDEILKDSENKFDVVLLMGPLYHLSDEKDRIRSVNNALKLLKPNGILFAAFISSYAVVWDFLVGNPESILDKNDTRENKMFYDMFVNDENFSGFGFAENHFIRPKDVEPFMAQFPLEKLHIVAGESFLTTREQELMRQPPEVFQAWLDLAEKVCEREDILSMSMHFLYAGKKI